MKKDMLYRLSVLTALIAIFALVYNQASIDTQQTMGIQSVQASLTEIKEDNKIQQAQFNSLMDMLFKSKLTGNELFYGHPQERRKTF